MKSAITVFALMMGLAIYGCGDDDSSDNNGGGTANGGGGGGGGQACQTPADCPTQHACIRVGAAPASCVPTCSGSVDECGASGQCAGVGVLEVNICREEPDPMSPPSPEEEPKIPCTEDTDCQAFHPEAICAQWRGARDCTLPCMDERVCDPPAVGGVAMDFSNCLEDEREDKMRTACLPREECFNNPLDCISGFSIPGGDGEDDDEEDFPGAGDLPDGF